MLARVSIACIGPHCRCIVGRTASGASVSQRWQRSAAAASSVSSNGRATGQRWRMVAPRCPSSQYWPLGSAANRWLASSRRLVLTRQSKARAGNGLLAARPQPPEPRLSRS